MLHTCIICLHMSLGEVKNFSTSGFIYKGKSSFSTLCHFVEHCSGIVSYQLGGGGSVRFCKGW